MFLKLRQDFYRGMNMIQRILKNVVIFGLENGSVSSD
jgi:hypothetical protein